MAQQRTMQNETTVRRLRGLAWLWSSAFALASIPTGCSTEVDTGSPSSMLSTGEAGMGGAIEPDPIVADMGGGDPFTGTAGMDLATAGAGGSAGEFVPPDLDTMVNPGGNDPVVADDEPSDLAKTIDAFACPGGSVGPGLNTLNVNGTARTFVADFPSDPTKQMGILFSYHGYNQAEGEHRTASNLNPDGNPDLPVVVITPDDVDFELPVGLDWQLDEGSSAKNVDLQFFEAMVGCLNAQYDIDPARIYALGFSAGSVMAALLHSAYPKIVRTIVAISGMWFNDQAQIDQILFAGLVLTPTWPALRPEDGGTILLTHGGLTDIAALIINLEAMAQAAFPFLAKGGRVVVDCPHTRGHTGHPHVGPAVISKFISENPADELSPYLSGGYAGFPSSCTLRLP